MDAMKLIRARHSVREYTSKPIEGEVLSKLREAVESARDHSGLNIQLLLDNPEVFDLVGRWGVISGCSSSIAFAENAREQDEAIGYWGQLIALRAQELGLNTCWVGTCSKKRSACKLAEGEKVRLVMAVGYGKDNGVDRKTKPVSELCAVEGGQEMPAWFASAMEAAQLAPTALNAQGFLITLRSDGRTVAAEAKRNGWRQVDLGIVKRNFELVADACGADWCWEA